MKIDYQKKFSLKNKKVYIFGGMGTIGKEVTRALTQFGAKIVLLDLKIKKKKEFKNKFKSKSIIYEEFDCKELTNISLNLSSIIKNKDAQA